MIGFGPYSLLKRIALGGMSEVFLARRRDDLRGELLVVKRILPHLQADDGYVQMFLDEARLTRDFHHENLIRIYDYGQAEGIHFIAMEYLDGLSLARLQRAQGKRSLPTKLGCFVVAEACLALVYAHAQKDASGVNLGIVHRDISPDNLLLSRQGEVKVADFGIAKATKQLSRTRPGQLKGKLIYMSPEQATSQAIDHRSDIFSIGSVLYELTTGRRLFGNHSRVELLRGLSRKRFTPPLETIEGYPPALAKIVCKALAFDVEERYQQADEIAGALDAFIGDERATARQQLGQLVDRLSGPQTVWDEETDHRTEV
jgi:serine/threonine-protein kinase